MVVKLLSVLGLLACIAVIVSGFLPWAYYADINQHFTGFYSFRNEYGRPGIFLSILNGLILVFMLLPKIWAKRTNLFLSALAVAYAFKSYVPFTSCYNNYCPEKEYGIFLMLGASILVLIASAFPRMSLNQVKQSA